MNLFDWIIIAIVAVSGLISIWRGFVKEAISLATWVAAFWIALVFAPGLATILPGSLESPMLRWTIAAVSLFMATLLVGGLANFLVSSLVERTGLSGTDRSLGTVFGILRGVVIVALIVLVAGGTTVDGEPWWQGSSLRPWFDPLADWMRESYPAERAESLISD